MGDYKLQYQQTSNSSTRAFYGAGTKPTGVTIHHWGVDGQSHANVVGWLRGAAGGTSNKATSAHYVVSAGLVTQLEKDERSTWHAGHRDGNGQTIGIEMRPEASAGDWATLVQLCADLEERHGSLKYHRHSDWKSTACPGRYSGRIGELVAAVNAEHVARKSLAAPQPAPVPLALVPPVGPDSRHLLPGSEYGARTADAGAARAYPHQGLDFQPSVRGAAEPIYAPCDLTITQVISDRAQGDKRNSLYAGHTGNAVEGRDTVGRLWSFRHNSKNLVKVGDKVRAGDTIALMGTTGNSNGVHVHIGLRVAGVFVDPEPILRDGHAWPIGNSYYTGKPSTPAPTQAPPRAPASGHVRSEASIRDICIKAGHGTAENSIGLLIERYQTRQAAPYKLVGDRQWGPKTEAHYQWVLSLQAALNAWKGDKIPVDGDYRGKTAARVLDWQTRNHPAVYAPRPDGIPGPTMCGLLKIKTYPN